MSLPTYPWFDQAPDNLKTKRQLAELGLRPGGPVVAQVVWSRGKKFAYLYDSAAALPKQPPTEAQLAALQKAKLARRTCYGCGKDTGMILWRGFKAERDCPYCYEAEQQERAQRIADDREEAKRIARAWLQSKRTVILDLETTDLNGYIVEIAIIRAHDGEILLDKRLNPLSPIDPVAQRIHGISAEMLESAPTFEELAERILELLAGKRVVTYNAAFDHAILLNEFVRLAGGADSRYPVRYAYHAAYEVMRRPRWRCAMELRAQAIGDWSNYHGNYKYYPLEGNHTALGDCLACRQVLMRMAEKSA